MNELINKCMNQMVFYSKELTALMMFIFIDAEDMIIT